MQTISQSSDGFFHPENEEQIAELIHYANQNGLKVRVRGAAHSVEKAIFTDNFRKSWRKSQDINIMLDKMRQVKFHGDRLVTVQAGCNLGVDPSDPTKSSNLENSLFYQLDKYNLAFPSTGGIKHQTVGGFLSTGSSGGSMSHSVLDHMVSLRFIDGKGEIHEVSKTLDQEKFYAVGVSMGLLGVITSVTFELPDEYHVMGQERTTGLQDCAVDLFGNGTGERPGLEKFLRETEYARILWWPQQGVNKVTVWQAHRMAEKDYSKRTGSKSNFKENPYQLFPKILGSDMPVQILTGIFYRMVKHWNKSGLLGGITRQGLKLTLSPVINLFASTAGQEGFQEFWDIWWRVLPMDDRLNDRWVPFEFTEVWLPIDKTTEIMHRLKELFERKGIKATGVYPCEIYAKQSNDFWMSPGYQRDSLRFNFFWFKKNPDDPAQTYYPQFWQLFEDLDFRLHWGKYLPSDPSWIKYLQARYPRWDDFMRLREQMDPNQIFVTQYWRKHLAIEPVQELSYV